MEHGTGAERLVEEVEGGSPPGGRVVGTWEANRKWTVVVEVGHDWLALQVSRGSGRHRCSVPVRAESAGSCLCLVQGGWA